VRLAPAVTALARSQRVQSHNLSPFLSLLLSLPFPPSAFFLFTMSGLAALALACSLAALASIVARCARVAQRRSCEMRAPRGAQSLSLLFLSSLLPSSSLLIHYDRSRCARPCLLACTILPLAALALFLFSRQNYKNTKKLLHFDKTVKTLPFSSKKGANCSREFIVRFPAQLVCTPTPSIRVA
jgi:hypothetical protein